MHQLNLISLKKGMKYTNNFRYVEMITEVLKKNLTFIIDPQYNDYCMRVKLIECVPVHPHSIYICTV